MSNTNKTEEIFLTTFDNPYDPFTESEEWLAFDVGKGYCTNSYIDRIAQKNNPNILTTRLKEEDFDIAIKEIVEFNPTIYKLVRRTVEEDLTQDLI